MEDRLAGKGDTDAPKDQPTGGGNTYIGEAKFELKAEINDDPARVIAALEEGVERVNRFRKSARRAPALARR